MRKITATLIITLVTLTGLFAQNNLDSGLIAFYPFDGTAKDFSGNEYHAINNGASYTTDRFGNPDAAAFFDGNSAWVNTKQVFDLEERSISIWLNAANIEGMDFNSKVALDMNSFDLTYGMSKVVFENGVLKVRAGGESEFHTYNTPITNTWYHLVLTRSATETQLYINNILLGSSSPGSLGSSLGANDTLIIGAGRHTDSQHFEGTIDDVRIYNRVLSPEEIDSLYEWDCNQTTNLVFETRAKKDAGLKLYPNPASDLFTISSEMLLSDETQVAIYASDGREMIRYTLTNTGAREQQIQVGELPKGLYQVVLSGPKGVESKPFVKQ